MSRRHRRYGNLWCRECVPHRSGPPSVTAPTPLYVRLVSIESVEQMTGFSFTTATRFVALVFITSWTYTCLPPEMLNVRDEMIRLENSLTFLSTSTKKKKTKSRNKPQSSIWPKIASST